MQLTASIEGTEVGSCKGNLQEVVRRRNAIAGLGEHLKNLVKSDAKVTPVDCPVTHRFAPGVYIREILMPKDTLIVGKIHKTSHFNEVISGECKVVTPASGVVEHFKAGDIFVSEAGVQKVVYNTTDVVWRTVHLNPSNTESEKELEADIIAETFDDIGHDQLIEECKRLGL